MQDYHLELKIELRMVVWVNTLLLGYIEERLYYSMKRLDLAKMRTMNV